MQPVQVIESSYRMLARALLCAVLAAALVGCDSTRSMSKNLSNLTNNGGVEIRTEPTGARLYVDNKYVGRSPHRTAMNRGKHLIIAKRGGYKDGELWHEVKSGRDETVEIKLEAE